VAVLSGCALAHAEKPVEAFFPVNPYNVHLTAACWNPVIQSVATVQQVGPVRPALSSGQ